MFGVIIGAGLGQHVERRLQQFGPRACEQHVAAGHRHRHRIGAGLDPVGQHGVPRAVKLGDALDDDARGAGAGDARAHLVEAVGDVDDFRLAGGVVDDASCPCASVAAISATWVPLTVTLGKSIAAPFRPPGAFAIT